MKAMLFESAGQPLQLTECPLPEPLENDVLIKVRACGVCRTDLHIVDGELPNPKPRLIPGHEIVGTVEAIGRRCARFHRRGSGRGSVAGSSLRRLPLLPKRP